MKNESQPLAKSFFADARPEPDLLGELGRATTAYFEATPDQLEFAREEYERALGRFQGRVPEPSEGHQSS